MGAIEKRSPQQELAATIRSDQFIGQVRDALPGGLLPERFVRAAVTAINQNPDIVKSERGAIFTSLLRCAQDGLLPDGREAALVMFGNAATYMPMIGGFRKIAAEHGWAIDTQVVYANDRFTYRLGLDPTLEHEPAPLGQDRGAPIGAYAVCSHADGRKQVEVMGAHDIEKVRNVSRAKNAGPWRDWPERMWEKTVGRRAFAKLPLSGRDEERIKRVLEASDDEYVLEAGTPDPVGAAVLPPDDGPDDTPLEGEIVEPEQPKRRRSSSSTTTSFADMVPPSARGEQS